MAKFIDQDIFESVYVFNSTIIAIIIIIIIIIIISIIIIKLLYYYILLHLIMQVGKWHPQVWLI